MTLSYDAAGVHYDQLDAFKRACQHAARGTIVALERHGYAEPTATRGESAYLLEADDHFLAHVEEGLGTKNLVADAMFALTGKVYYDAIGVDTVATIVNDVITSGALPVSVAMHAAVGDSAWFEDAARANALVEGFARACLDAGAVWGGGETPTLRGIVERGAIVLAGSALGKIAPKDRRIVGDIQHDDAIVFLASSGVQTNGLTLCRQIAERLPAGYLTPIGHGDDRTFGEALLAPSVIYAAFVRECQSRGIAFKYLAHVTGHGWRKLMRAEEPFVYEIHTPRPAPALFEFMIEAGPIEVREAYATFNMGVGFAAYVAPDQVDATIAAATETGYAAWLAGRVRKEGTRKAVAVPSLGLEFDGATLQVR